MAGILYLVPVTLGGEDFLNVIPQKVISITKRLRVFIVEDIRSARRFLRLIDKTFPIDKSTFFELNEHTGEADISEYLEPLKTGNDIGVMSEAGLPGIADPGARIVALAHRKNMKVIPLSGPSSIILALISSGFNGQNFTFNGYLPVKASEKVTKIKEIEKKANDGIAQIFIETPYRNQKLFDSLIHVCAGDTMLCIATDLTLPTECILSMKISAWKKEIPSLDNRPTVFVLQ